jgi:hypothetical protein
VRHHALFALRSARARRTNARRRDVSLDGATRAAPHDGMAHGADELDALLAADGADDGLLSPPRGAPRDTGGARRAAAPEASPSASTSPPLSPFGTAPRFPGPAAAYARSPVLLALRDGGGGSAPPWSPADDAAAAAAAAHALSRAHGGAFASRAWREGLAAVGLRAFDASAASPLAPGAGGLARGGGGSSSADEPARVCDECVAPCVLAVVAALSATPFGDARATLCDPSGCVEALLSADVAEGGGEHAAVMEGALVLLRNVPLLAPALEPRRRALVVPAGCVARVWAPPLRRALALGDGRGGGGGGGGGASSGGGGALVLRRRQQGTAASVPPPLQAQAPPHVPRVPPRQQTPPGLPPPPPDPVATAAAAAVQLPAVVLLPPSDDWSMLDAADDAGLL